VNLTTDRLLLRELLETDLAAVREYAVDPDVARYMTWDVGPEEVTRSFIDNAIRDSREQPRRKYDLAVVLKDENRLIGACGLYLSEANLRAGEIGYALHRGFWRQGYATELARELVRFSFEDLKLHRVLAWCHRENPASARVLEKAGMQREGFMREAKWIKEAWWDIFTYAVLEQDWPVSG